MSRRKFLGKGAQAVVAGGVALSGIATLESRAATRSAAKGVDYYQKLGVTPFINAAGTYTVLSASTMPDEVQEAIALAAKQPVNLNELLEASGAYLAKQLRCEAALVTSGAAAALVVGTAACVTLGNEQSILGIPTDMAGLKNEVIVQKSHRYGYDHALRNCGIRFVEVETLEQYEHAFNERTVMAHFFNAGVGKVGREDWVRVAHRHGVPCFNDAAADVPPISNLWNYTQMGFDLVTFSGGKGLRAPQCTGLLLGRKDLIDAARKNNSPNSNTIGRGMKVAKEEIVGLVAAVDWFLKQDDAAMEAEYRGRADRIAKQLSAFPTLQTQIFIPEVANHVPHLLITYDQNRIKITGAEVMQKMREGKTRIELNPSTGGAPASAGLPGGSNTIVIGVWMLQPGEDLVVAKRLREVLQQAIST
ncbi:MAG TPA: aminotransferase class V-fold PLP-dependent enzyme [Candidatus Sulfotelmatobacter sp.]|jgi:L-seryl-tRNA(Ser) seleniumtransferase|nr:aminotransferase class V-fold PLP-dependent enzyme [Candidatus Sulfotelmatobacter sp.]